MFRHRIAPLFLIAALALGLGRSTEVGADEGMWIPPSFGKELDMKRLEAMGLKYPADKIFATEGPGLNDAILQVVEFQENGGVFGFGSAAFVSPKGLILTNHHVAFDAVAANSTPERNLVRDGFRAATLADELHCPNTGVRVCTTYEDVTAVVTGGVRPDMDDATRDAVIRTAVRGVLESAKQNGLGDAEVKIAFNGLRYYLTAYDTFKDVRLVYVPAQAIGEYGGDVDNWIWPRHTGDFTYLRAYVAPDGSRAEYSENNVPYDSVQHLELDARGIAEEDFCFIMGFPGTTFRGRTSLSVEYRERFLYPSQIEALKREIARLEAEGRQDPKKAIDNLSRIKSLANSLKNFEGMVDGLAKTGLVKEKAAEEKAFRDWVAADPARQAAYGDIFPTIEGHYAKLFNSEGLLGALSRIMQGPFMSGFVSIGALAEDAAAQKPQIDARSRASVVAAIGKAFEELGQEGQRKELRAAVDLLMALPEGQRPRAVFFEDLSDVGAWVEKAVPHGLGAKEVEEWSVGAVTELPKSPIGALRFGLALANDFAAINTDRAAFSRDIGSLRRRLTTAWSEWKGSLGYPDADSTLRLTYGRIRGYSPRDAVQMKWYTTVEGVLEKHTGVAPFDAPANLRELASARKFGSWADPKLGTLVCNFLSDTDITGGNSGSPIMNGEGGMIGIAFDGNYEAMTSDYQFMPAITRTINVDIRYVLWCTEIVDGMQRLIDEMPIRR